MAAGKGASAASKKDPELLTLSEVSRRTGISMPTLLRYKKDYRDRIPSQGEGRKQRYPKESLKVFREIKKENLAKRGRPSRASEDSSPAKKTRSRTERKSPSSSKPKSKKLPEPDSLLSLLQISKLTGIEYTRLQRLTKKYSDEIPMEGMGRARKYYAEAIEIYKRLDEQGASPSKTVAAGAKTSGTQTKRKAGRVKKVQAKTPEPGDAGPQKKLLTLSEVSRRTKISMPTLLRYKKHYQDRIPSQGEGRKQRYPIESLEVFREIKRENLGKRGRPPMQQSNSNAPKIDQSKSEAAVESGAVFSLLQISKATGIEYTKLQRLTKKYLDEIPTTGAGRARKYFGEAIDVFRRLEAQGASRVRTASAGAKRATRRAAREVKRVTKEQVKAIGFDEAALQQKLAKLEDVNKGLRKDMASLQREMKSLVKNLKKSIRFNVLK